MDLGDFSLLTSLPQSEFLIGLNISTSLLKSLSGELGIGKLTESGTFV